MIELSRHIESLMLKHDCVIVPGLGGFVTQYVPARRVDDEQLFCRLVAVWASIRSFRSMMDYWFSHICKPMTQTTQKP